MPTYNTAIAVVDLIEAESELDALEILGKRLRDAGFETYDDSYPIIIRKPFVDEGS